MSNGMAQAKLEDGSIRKILQSAPQGVSCNKPYWKCICTNTHMRNKKGELKALAQSQGFEMIGISRTGGMSSVAGVPQWMAGWEHNTASTGVKKIPRQVQKITKTPG